MRYFKTEDLVTIEGEGFIITEVLRSSSGNVYKCKSLVDNCYGFDTCELCGYGIQAAAEHRCGS